MSSESLAKLKMYATRKMPTIIEKYDGAKFSFEITPSGEPLLMISYDEKLDCFHYNAERKEVEEAGIAYYSFQTDRTKEKNNFMYIGYIRSYDQQQGIGSLMMNYLERLARENDCKFIDLIAATGTEDFYKRFGFKRNFNRKRMHHYAKEIEALESKFHFAKPTSGENL